MAAHIRSWLEVVSDGTSGGTHVHLVVSAGNKQEFRYEIPGVTSAQWTCFAGAKAQLQLVLAGVTMKTQVEIKSDTTQLETLLTEIAAARLSSDDDDVARFTNKVTLPAVVDEIHIHATWCALRCVLNHECDCGATV